MRHVPPRLARALLPALLLASLLVRPGTARGAEEYVAAPAVVKVDGSQAADGRVFGNPERTVYLVLVPGERYLYRVDRPARTVSSLARASALVKGDRCRPMDGASAMVLQGGLYEEVEGGFTFNALSGKKVAVYLIPR